MTDHSEAPQKLSPLHRVHLDAGASFTDFAGWQMPVRYTSDLAEHHAVRAAAGIFDLSHMAEISVTGQDAPAFLDFALAGKLSGVAVSQAKYSLLLDEHGGIIDDLVVYHAAPAEYLVVANAGNHDAALAALTDRAAHFQHVEVADRSAATALIAVQGPRSRAILEATEGLVIADGQAGLADLKYYWSTAARFGQGTVFIGRTGYTGEDGFELYVDVSDAEPLWRALVAAGEAHGLVPAGLASRDSLRLEAGMPLYGHELGQGIVPAQAGLGRVVNFTKEGDFVGRTALETSDTTGARVLVGLAADGKRAARAGYAVYSTDAAASDPPGEPVGVVTSGILSPTLGHPIALAYVEPHLAAPDTTLFLDVRGTRIPARVVVLPFYKREAR
ncbi:MAG TPA: glycine cleavage system aminomethyltransferase GcvT [Microbacteriaceae bacterium]